MNINNKKLFLSAVILLTSLTVVGCSPKAEAKVKLNANEVTQNNSSTQCSSIKDAVTKLANSKNYTIHVDTKTGPINVSNNMYYTEKAFYDDYLGDEYGYVECDDGVYRFDRYNRKFTPSALLKDSNGELVKSVWGNGYFYGFASLDLSEFESADGLTFKCSKKKNKLAFMKMFSIAQTYYQYVENVELTLGDSKDINTLSFQVSMKKEAGTTAGTHKCVIQNFGTTKIKYLDKQLANGETYYKPEGKLAHVMDLFSSYNYTHFLYEDETSDPTFNINNPYGWEKFNENYFISGYTEEYLEENVSALLTCSGMVGFNNEVISPYKTMNGSYYTYVHNDSFSIVSSMVYNEDPYIPNVYTYPTLLEAFSSSQYFDVSGDENTYYTTKLSILSDFCDNFQLWENIQSLGVTIDGLYIKYDEKGYNNQETVTFSLEYNKYGFSYTSDFVFSNFGKTEEKVLEKENVVKYLKAVYGGDVYFVTVNPEANKEATFKQISAQSNTAWLFDDTIKAAYTTKSQTTIYVNEGDTVDFRVYEASKDDDFENANKSSQVAYSRATSISNIKAKNNNSDVYYYDEASHTYKYKVTAKVVLDLQVNTDGTILFDAVIDN